jgi:hypothetical protein
MPFEVIVMDMKSGTLPMTARGNSILGCCGKDDAPSARHPVRHHVYLS